MKHSKYVRATHQQMSYLRRLAEQIPATVQEPANGVQTARWANAEIKRLKALNDQLHPVTVYRVAPSQPSAKPTITSEV